jgi:hypothetical protein
VNEPLDLDSYFDDITSLHTKIKYVIEPNLTWPDMAVPEQLRPFINPLRELYADQPTSGHWIKGQMLFNSQVTHHAHIGLVNTAEGQPGTWSYFGKTTPFPIGPQDGTVLEGDIGKYTFDLPASNNFTAMVTIACNPRLQGSGAYFTSLTFILSLDTGWNGSEVTNYLSHTVLHTPTLDSFPPVPEISSIHFGSEDTGSRSRPHSAGGQVTITWRNCSFNPKVSIEPLFVR